MKIKKKVFEECLKYLCFLVFMIYILCSNAFVKHCMFK